MNTNTTKTEASAPSMLCEACNAAPIASKDHMMCVGCHATEMSAMIDARESSFSEQNDPEGWAMLDGYNPGKF